MKNKLVLFYSETCKPCQFQKPLVEKVAKEYKIALELICVDNDKAFNFAQQYGIKSWPTLLFIVNNIVSHELIGYDTNSNENLNKQRLLEDLKNLKFI